VLRVSGIQAMEGMSLSPNEHQAGGGDQPAGAHPETPCASALALELRRGSMGALIAGGTAAAACFAGLLDQSAWRLAVASALAAVVGFFLTAAATAEDAERRSMWLVRAVAVLLLGAVFTFTLLWPASHGRVVAEYTVDGVGEEAGFLEGSGEAGGPPLHTAVTLWRGHTYQFGCQVVLHGGVVWLRLADAPYWYQLEGLHPPQGTSPPSLPSC
jgi:hypothetical protein